MKGKSDPKTPLQKEEDKVDFYSGDYPLRIEIIEIDKKEKEGK